MDNNNTKRVMDKIMEIEKEIDNSITQNTISIGNVSSGTAGAVLFYYHLFQLTGNAVHLEKCTQTLYDMFEKYTFKEFMFTYCSGQAGINWLTSYLIKKDILDQADYDAVADTQPFLFYKMIQLLKTGFYDFLHAGLGNLFCIINAPINDSEKEETILLAVNLLEERAHKNEDGTIFWHNVNLSTQTVDLTECNMGLAHGVPSIIAVLAKASDYVSDPVLKERILNMASDAARFIVSVKSRDESTLSYYPFGISEVNNASYNSRLSWCYGDLGIALSFWHLYKATKDPVWKEEIISILDKAVKRTDNAKNMLVDAAICHGTAGVSHIFRIFYKRLKKPEYLKTADFWLEKTFQMASFPDGIAGYKSYFGERGYVPTIGFLEGTIGIGLVMISSISDNNSDWDQFWLMS